MFSGTATGSTQGLNNIAAYSLSGNSWAPLAGGGLDGFVQCLGVNGSALVVGGDFLRSGDAAQTLNHVATYSDKFWNPLGPGVPGSVHAVAVSASGVLHAGARLDDTTVKSNVFVYDSRNRSWSPLPNGLFWGAISALATNADEVYVGGQLSDSGGVHSNGIVRYAGGQWRPFPSGGLAQQSDVAVELPAGATQVTQSYVNAIVVQDDTLLVGGMFDVSDDNVLKLKNFGGLSPIR